MSSVIDDPVCGTDGQTYSNSCSLEVQKCLSGGKIKLAYDGECRTNLSEQQPGSRFNKFLNKFFYYCPYFYFHPVPQLQHNDAALLLARRFTVQFVGRMELLTQTSRNILIRYIIIFCLH